MKIALFASGGGTNAEAFFKYFKNSETTEIALLLSNRGDAYALQRAHNHGVPAHTFGRNDLYDSDAVLEVLRQHDINLIVLAGFLWLIPKDLIDAYPDKIINVHPALLPKYSGRGMYGMKVHQAVKASNETESGITIHLASEAYDEGRILSQHTVAIDPSDSPDDIAGKIHTLEYRYFPKVVEQYIKELRED